MTRSHILFRSAFLATSMFAVTTLALPGAARATNYFVSPSGTGTDCWQDSPCSLDTGAKTGTAGDFVFLMDGTYQGQSLNPVNSGTSSDWLTFAAFPGAVPILDGGGGSVGGSGVGSGTSVYVRFIGIVARNWASGFTNKWIGSNADGTTTDFTANGNWQYINCIADGNTRNGFAFNSSKGILARECISAHNGTSTTSSWSSGFQLFAVQGTAADNIIERNVAFENMDAERHTDGSGFIVDTQVTGVSFINNLAFLNGGSGIRLTDSANIKIINNTFYHNGQDPADTTSKPGPPNPGEIYFTDGGKTSGLTFTNNVGVGSGSSTDPTEAWIFNGAPLTLPASNKISATFANPDGTNPDFRLASGNALVDQGDSSGAPSSDIGFDPKCIKKTVPTDIAVPSWTAYGVDYAYIKTLGGVSKCWQPGTRPGGTTAKIDVGAYELDATPVPTGTGGFAIGGRTGAGGGAGAGGATGNGGAAGGNTGTSTAGGAGGASGGSAGNGGGNAGNTGGSAGNNSTSSGGGAGNNSTSSGGNNSAGSGGNNSAGASGSGGSKSGGTNGSGGQNNTGGSTTASSSSSGCTCTVGGQSSGGLTFALLLGAVIVLGRRRALRRQR